MEAQADAVPQHEPKERHLVAEVSGVPLPPHAEVTGRNVLATEARASQDGLPKDPGAYPPFPSEAVGADAVRLVLGPTSGSAAVAARVNALGVPGVDDVLARGVQGGAERAPRSSRDDPDPLLLDLAAAEHQGMAT
jgi:isopropylmalate/homocitrate/citramalate synthase